MQNDTITQEQLTHLAEANRRAVGARMCVIIAGDGDQNLECVGVSAVATGADANAAEAVTLLMAVAAAAIDKATNGQCSVVLRTPNGDRALRPRSQLISV